MLKDWKPNARQKQILGILGLASSPMAPSAIGEACGQPAGAVASKWTYHALKTLVAKGKVVKKGVGLYEVVTADSPDQSPDEHLTNADGGTSSPPGGDPGIEG